MIVPQRHHFEGLLVAMAAPVLAVVLVHFGWLWRLDDVLYDWALRTLAHGAADDVVIVAIDEQSLDVLGQWPWPRRVHADLLDRLTAAQPKAIALDVIMTEPDASDPQGDLRLAEAIRRNGHVILPVAFGQPVPGGQVVELLPLAALTEAAAGFGHVDVVPDPDGVTRAVYLKAGLGSPYWPSLALAMLEHVDTAAGEHLPGQRAELTEPPSPYGWIRDYRVLVPFAGPPGTYRQVSYVDVLRGEVPRPVLRGRFVLVGAVANGLGGQLAIPLTRGGRPMSGVEFNANVLDGLRRSRTIQELDAPWPALFSALAVLVPILLYVQARPRWTLPIAGASLVVTLIACLLLLHVFCRWFPPSAALLTSAATYPIWSWMQLRGAVRYRRAFAEAQERALITLHSVGDGVITTDASGLVQDLNPTAQRLTGYDPSEARGRPLEDVLQIVTERGRRPITMPPLDTLPTQTITRLSEKCVLIARTGDEAVVRTSLALIRSREGAPLGMVLAVADVTETHRLTLRMAYQATHDDLTGLPNRALLEDRLQHAIARATRAQTLLSVLFVDLDRFKTVNDGLGHTAGDALLRAVAARLREGLRETDTIARLGGDEFVVLLEHLPEDVAAEAVAQKILTSFATPFAAEGHEIVISASVGVAIFPRDGKDAPSLLKNADSAMYRAKQVGRANVQFYTSELGGRALDRFLLLQRLPKAIDRDEFRLYFQPQIDVSTRRITGVEALVRWYHPERGVLEPDAFVPAAEATSLITSLDDWVIRAACAQARAWQRTGLPHLRVAVNLSPRQVARPDIGAIIARTLAEAGLPPHQVELEITERTIMQDLDRTIDNLHALKAIGVTIAIDDFGTGYSSLSYLKTLPVDRLKIDRSFIRATPADKESAAIADAIIAMAHRLGLGVLAEGVETDMQMAFLEACGCDEAQGYLICRPVPGARLSSALQQLRGVADPGVASEQT